MANVIRVKSFDEIMAQKRAAASGTDGKVTKPKLVKLSGGSGGQMKLGKVKLKGFGKSNAPKLKVDNAPKRINQQKFFFVVVVVVYCC